ncbi:MAG: transglutaminase domain-containing protein [Verrucomicrobia bacterium]|nr:transglutaminase domain-containing protein [Verrucomicrobiota bacterium]
MSRCFALLGLVLGFGCLAVRLLASSHPVLSLAAAMEARGDFGQADEALARLLSDTTLAPDARRELEWERERLRRIRLDYSHTEASLFAALSESVRGLTRGEFDRWVKEGRFDSRVIDGERRFVASSVSNLFFRHPRLNSRRLKGGESAEQPRRFLGTARGIRDAARVAGTPYVLPRQLSVTMELTVKAGVAGQGEVVRCWLPIPRSQPHQDEFALISSEPLVAALAPDDSVIRSAYFEQTAAVSRETSFRIEYTYRTWSVWFDLRPERIVAIHPDDPEIAPFLAEAPHVPFTDSMRRLAKDLAGREKNPLLRAKRYYDWIAQNIRYSYAREYSTIPNLAEYCLENRYGDCGQETFLFMTLCRLSGIPARWQSGWRLFPGAKTIHDWCEIYLAPYGWVPVDPYMGIYAMQYAPSLNRSERRSLRDFYFGGLDPYRLIANADHCQPLSPPKTSFRSDTVDFQRGEVEVAGRNVYFGDFSYRLEWREVDAR